MSRFKAGFEFRIVSSGNRIALCILIVEHVVQWATTVIIFTQVNDAAINIIGT